MAYGVKNVYIYIWGAFKNGLINKNGSTGLCLYSDELSDEQQVATRWGLSTNQVDIRTKDLIV